MSLPLSIQGNKKDVTVLRSKDLIIDSQYGDLSYLAWSMCEINRIKNKKYYLRFATHEGFEYCCISKR
jgi:hypothetical protein